MNDYKAIKHPIKWRLFNYLTYWRDKPYVWSRPLDWVRYEILFNEDMYHE